MGQPIILIGYRATGKTTVARILAQRLGCRWFDSDLLIEQRAAKPISRIFAEEGEPTFRDWEAEEIASLFRLEAGGRRLEENISVQENPNPNSTPHTPHPTPHTPLILATGGGAILRESTRNLLRRSGKVVWLTASEQTIFQRMSQDETTKQRRPDLTALPPLEEIAYLLQTRNPLYEQTAHIRLCTEENSPESLCERILDERQHFFK